MSNYYVTEDRLNELKQELEIYKTTKRIEVSDRLKKAKELGDLSENAEYTEAREEQERVENRILELEDLIKNSVVIKSESANKKIADVGSMVEVSRDGKVQKFRIVGATETRPEQGLISNDSPLGRVIVGKKAGDTVVVETPDRRKIAYKITDVS